VGVPTDYDGSHSTSTNWLYAIKAYLLINDKLYNTNDKRIAFALSYMKKGVALGWATTIYQESLDK
ncbi:hypothetical protein BS17DRAFT_677549, partial [Gyrodon lividus]